LMDGDVENNVEPVRSVLGGKLKHKPQLLDWNRYTGMVVLVLSKGGYEWA